MSFPYIVKQRPVCAHCGKKCGTRAYQSTGSTNFLIAPDYKWDGVSWYHKYNPFCTLRCALSYARMAAAHKVRS